MRNVRLAVVAITSLIFGLLSPVSVQANPNHVHDYLLSFLTINGQQPIHKYSGGGFDPYFPNYVFNISGPLSDVELAWGLDPQADVTLTLDESRSIDGWSRDEIYLDGAYATSQTIPAEDLCVESDVDNPAICEKRPVYALLTLTVFGLEEDFDYQIELAWPDSVPGASYVQTFDDGLLNGTPPSQMTLNGPQFMRFPTTELESGIGGKVYVWFTGMNTFTPAKGYVFVDSSKSHEAFALNYSDTEDFSLSIYSMSTSTLTPATDSGNMLYRSLNMDLYEAEYFEFFPGRLGNVNSWDPWLYGHYRLELRSWPANVILDTVDSRTSARTILSTGTDCNSLQSQACSNVFKLSIEVIIADQTSTASADFFLMRQTDVTVIPDVRIHWDDQTTETTRLDWQDWFVAPAANDPLVTSKTPSGSYFAGYATADGGNVVYQPGERIPVFADLDLYPVWEELVAFPNSINFLGEVLTFGPCVLGNPERTCLFHNNLEYEPDVRSYDPSYHLALPLNWDLTDPTDDANQVVSVNWGPQQNTFSSISARDYRHYPQEGTDYPHNIDQHYPLPDSEICNQGEDCIMIWRLYVGGEAPGGSLSFGAEVNILLTENVNAMHRVAFAAGIGEQPGTQVNHQTGWHDLPAEDPELQGYEFGGWGAAGARDPADSFFYNWFPVLQAETIYPIFYEQFNFRWFDGEVELDARTVTWEINPYEFNNFTNPTSQDGHAFLGWATTPDGTPVTMNDYFGQSTNFYAIWQIPAPNQNQQAQQPPPSVPPVQNESTTVVPVIPPVATPPATPVVSDQALKPISTKTMTAVSRENGITTVESVIPAKYVNRPARIEVRRVINGKVRFYTIGRAWTHYDRKRNDFSKAAMTFRFPLELKPNDIIRVKVRGVQVVRANGEGKPAWR